MTLNFLWSPIFFFAHLVGVALIVVLALLVTTLAFVVTSWRRDHISAWLFVPYAAWVAFASLLNSAIWALN